MTEIESLKRRVKEIRDILSFVPQNLKKRRSFTVLRQDLKQTYKKVKSLLERERIDKGAILDESQVDLG